MLMAAKNQLKASSLSVKYALMKEMLNKTTFMTNIIFMILNNSSFIIQWIVLYSLKDNIGGYSIKEVLLLWGIAAGTYGVSHFFFKNAYNLSDTINNGKLDSYLVQPKNVLISSITSSVETSAIGDMIYAIILFIIYGFSLPKLFLYVLLCILGGLILTSFTVILNSLSFWFNRSDIIADTMDRLVTSFATYPDGIFKGVSKLLLYTIVPVGISTYLPTSLIISFNLTTLAIVLFATSAMVSLAFIVFNTGLKRYSSSNLMIARI